MKHKRRVHKTDRYSGSVGNGTAVTRGDCGEIPPNKFQLRVGQQRQHRRALQQTGRGSAVNNDYPEAGKTRQQKTFPENADTNLPADHQTFIEDDKNMPAGIYPAELTEDNHRQIYKDNWNQIRTKHSRNNKIQDRYNFRLDNLTHNQLAVYLNKIFQEQKLIFKLNLSFGFILRNNETGDYRYYHSKIALVSFCSKEPVSSIQGAQKLSH